MNRLKHPIEPGTLWFFYDEKNFCHHQVHNAQNNRRLAVNQQEVPRVMKTKFLQLMMVFDCVSINSDVVPPHAFKEGLWLNSDGFVEVRSKVAKPWAKRAAAEQPYMWQRDLTPCRTSGKSQKLLLENFFGYADPNMWPPSSPECNPMNY